MENRKETALEVMIKMANEGKRYQDIAKYLNKTSVPSASGKPWSRPMVSHALIAAGIKKSEHKEGVTKTYQNGQPSKRKSRRRRAQVSPAAPIVTKWEVLKVIDACGEFTPSARKALLDLVWREVNK